MSNFRPLPSKVGFGFSSETHLGTIPGYNLLVLEKNNTHLHNYYFTRDNYVWPETKLALRPVLDGFSPNLNKYLHAGHLKNLAVASALANLTNAQPVAMIGASLGRKEGAFEQYQAWCDLARYQPKIYFDTELPKLTIPLRDGEPNTQIAHTKEPQDTTGCKLFDGPQGPIIVQKSGGQSTYAAHDLTFAVEVKPDFYLTGAEQKPHFESLGLGTKHLPLGLLMGADGRKMASSSGEPVSAAELFESVQASLKETPNPQKLAWNIIACQMNYGARSGLTKFNLKEWARAEAPGMYLTYSYARVLKALKAAGEITAAGPTNADDLELCAWGSYYQYAYNRAVTYMEPHHMAHYALDLARVLIKYYNSKRIVGGDASYLFSLNYALQSLGKSMRMLGMYILEEV